MNTDKIYAEHIANEYSAKKESKVIALKNLIERQKLPQMYLLIHLELL